MVAPGVAHHITQRRTERQTVFHRRTGHLTQLRLLRAQAALGSLSGRGDAAHHGRYAQYPNSRRGRCGHLWQNRFSSCALGPAHLWAALR